MSLDATGSDVAARPTLTLTLLPDGNVSLTSNVAALVTSLGMLELGKLLLTRATTPTVVPPNGGMRAALRQLGLK